MTGRPGWAIFGLVHRSKQMQKLLDSALGSRKSHGTIGMNGLKDLNDCYFLPGRDEPMLGHSQPQ